MITEIVIAVVGAVVGAVAVKILDGPHKIMSSVREKYEKSKEKRRTQKIKETPERTLRAMANYSLDTLCSYGIALEEIKINGVLLSNGHIARKQCENVVRGDHITLPAEYADILLAGYNNDKIRAGVDTYAIAFNRIFAEEQALKNKEDRGEKLTFKEEQTLLRWRWALQFSTTIEGKYAPGFVPHHHSAEL